MNYVTFTALLSVALYNDLGLTLSQAREMDRYVTPVYTRFCQGATVAQVADGLKQSLFAAGRLVLVAENQITIR